MQRIIDSPVGPIRLTVEGAFLTGLHFTDTLCESDPGDDAVMSKVIRQLDEYFSGKRRVFDLPLALKGTPFQMAVWEALQKIPYGEVCSYADIATAVGNPKACRAVGMANHRNPISIIIPCHRVIGSNGALTGYGGGLYAKEKLLDLEKRYV